MLPHSKCCVLPWISVETTPVGTMRPCCLALQEISAQGQPLKLLTSTVTEAYRSEHMQQLREQFRQGQQPDTCQRCWNEEAAGRTSKRMHSNLKFNKLLHTVDWNNNQPDQLWFLDLKLGNICNLKCRICGPWSSSKWAQEQMPVFDKKTSYAYHMLKQGRWPRDSVQFWNNLQTLLPGIQYFEFTGGEPFLIKEHFELLQTAVDLGVAGNISIHYNTNGTVWPDQHALWQHFKHVEIAFSIDNIGAMFEYERHGADWNQVAQNVLRFQQLAAHTDNINTQVCITINVQNVLYIQEICDWVSQQAFDFVYFNMLHDPEHMNIGCMTAQAKELVVQKLMSAVVDNKYRHDIQGIIKFIQNGVTGDGKQFCQSMKLTDAIRNQNFAHTHAEIAQAMGYEST